MIKFLMLQNSSPKYIFVSGGVLSGVGKGIVTASVALLLKSRGLKVTVVKCENYLNLDSGLINPIEHGDPFLCEDGAETDMDIGTYEKFLDQDLGLKNFITMGQIYKAVIDRERNFGYRGEDVEAIPHVTDEIIKRIQEAGEKDKAEIIIIELGGTTGEYQNALYYEAARILQFVKHVPVVHIHVSYLPTPPHLGEPKTKPTQLSVRLLNGMGIHPDFIVARAIKRMDDRRRARFALFCSVPSEHIIDAPDVKSVYELPLIFHDQAFDQKIVQALGINTKPSALKEWTQLVHKINKPRLQEVSIAIVGKYFQTGDYQLRDAYAALFDALDHAATFHELKLKIVGVNSEDIDSILDKIKTVDGIIVPIGWGARGVEGKIKAIQYAREQKVPYLGLCYGMQLAVVEFARNVLGYQDAHTVEVDPKTTHPVIHMIPEQQRILKLRAYGGTMRLGTWDCVVAPNSLADEIYSKNHQYDDPKIKLVSERHRHRWEFNDEYAKVLTEKGLVISGRSVKENLVELIELPQSVHPFFIGTQGHPEYKSRPLKPHAFFIEFLRAAYMFHQTIAKPPTT
jgi:CTP synthase